MENSIFTSNNNIADLLIDQTNLLGTSKLPVRCTDNTIMFYIRWFWRMSYMRYSMIVIEFY